MTGVISVLSLLAFALSLNAQITATLNSSNGLDHVTIRNNSTASLVAFVVTVYQAPRSHFSTRAPLVVYSDPLIDPGTTPLPASEERVVITRGAGFSGPRGMGPSAKKALAEPIVTAGIFADGTTTGDPTLLGRLTMRRA